MNESNSAKESRGKRAWQCVRRNWRALSAGVVLVAYAFLLPAYVGHIQLVAALLEPEHELWSAVGARELGQIEIPNAAFKKALEQLLDAAIESSSLADQAYLHNRINFWWNVRREMPFLPRMSDVRTDEQAAISGLRVRADTALRHRLNAVVKSLCQPADEAAAGALKRFLTLVDYSLNNCPIDVTYSRYEESVNSAPRCES